MPPRPITRRTFLAAAAAAGGAALAAPGRTGATGTPVLPPGTLPHHGLAAGTDTLPEIEHIVVLMMENHSFDDHLGMLGRGDGLTPGHDGRPVNFSPDPAGGYVRSFHNPNTCGYQASGVSQSWDASHISWDHGTNLGFVKACGPASMGYWTGEDLPFYYSMARQFPIGDRYFCSVMAQTYPNRRFLIGGTALGNVATNGTGVTGEPPNGTIFDLLDAHGISWKNYYPDVPSCALFLPVFQRNQNNGKVVHVDQFFTDAAAGTLPSFSLVDPYTDFSEEGNDISIGEAYAATMVNAVLESPAWERTALIWTYDEHGGWYDHVPPVP
ncbi:MAG TPA: alkaline phosphatase family protein, partial [Acidimicrobiales bacterium]|nr:alkaline phosphatase family protein [Acidimicrobiales bacterium]